jgi:hypothetical protein
MQIACHVYCTMDGSEMGGRPPASTTAGKPATRAVRDEQGRLMPGSVLNPGGRPKGLEKRVRELVDFDAITLALQDIALGRQPKSADGTPMLHAEIKTSDRIKAAALLYDRGHGKAKQAIELAAAIEHAGPGSLELDGLDDAALELLESVLARRLEGGGVIDANAEER